MYTVHVYCIYYIIVYYIKYIICVHMDVQSTAHVYINILCNRHNALQ